MYRRPDSSPQFPRLATRDWIVYGVRTQRVVVPRRKRKDTKQNNKNLVFATNIFSFSFFFIFKRNMFFMVAVFFVFFRSSQTVKQDTHGKRRKRKSRKKKMTGVANGSNLVRHRCAFFFSSFHFIFVKFVVVVVGRGGRIPTPTLLYIAENVHPFWSAFSSIAHNGACAHVAACRRLLCVSLSGAITQYRRIRSTLLFSQLMISRPHEKTPLKN